MPIVEPYEDRLKRINDALILHRTQEEKYKTNQKQVTKTRGEPIKLRTTNPPNK